ncbi:prmt6, partial [Symbiodinium natans]
MSDGCDALWDVSLHDLRAVYDPEMHLSMLRDSRRHQFYDQCLAKHVSELRGKVVIDVGAGTGILSALAVRGGAAQVHAVEALPELCKLIPKVLAGALPKEE